MWQTKADKIRKIKKNVCKLSLHLLYLQFSLMMTRLSTQKLWIQTQVLASKQWTLCDFSDFATIEQSSTDWCWLVVGVDFPSSSMWTVMLWKLPIGFHRLWLWPHWSHGSQPTFHSCTFSAQGYQNNSLIWIQCECVGVKGGENQN